MGYKGTSDLFSGPSVPELPEVETVCRGLRPALEGHRILRVQTRRGDLRIPFPEGFGQRLTGRTVKRLSRRAKYILAALDSGETLVIHLGMSGRMAVYAEGKERKLGQYVYDVAPSDLGRGKHDHVVIETDAPAKIVFTDYRRFGLMTLVETSRLNQDKLFKDLGPEPLSEQFGAEALRAALMGRKTSIKAALLDQRNVSGLGNIYVCEALYRAHISPRKQAGRITAKGIARLLDSIKAVLQLAIKAGGSSLRDYRTAEGDLGNFQHHFSVYDRAGEPCRRKGCTGTIKRIVQSGRSTFYCPTCQT